MSESVYDLIGQIINPRPATRPAAAAPRAMAVAGEPVSVLIGRIIAPSGPVARETEPEPVLAAAV